MFSSKEQIAYAEKAKIPVWQELDLGGGVKMRMVLIAPGEFMMGSPDTEKDRWGKEEGPVHRVRITKPFYAGIYDVTQEQYKATMGDNPSKFTGDNNPVEMVSWNDATDFCKKATQKAGLEVRLPTEAEWEYACRAGTTTRFSYGDDTNYDELANYAWYSKNSDNKTHPVGEKLPNPWGLYDMHGNVWQWCQDWYGEKYYAESPNEDPKGPQIGAFRVLRGGSWSFYPLACRSASRLRHAPTTASYHHGFRVVVVARTHSKAKGTGARSCDRRAPLNLEWSHWNFPFNIGDPSENKTGRLTCMKHYKLSVANEGDFAKLTIGFLEPASNDAIVAELEVSASLSSARTAVTGKVTLVNGPASLPVACVLAHALSHVTKAIGVFDPKLAGYVIAVSHDPAYKVGSLLKL